MVEAYKKFWKNYTNFQGRTTRSDFWYVILCNMIIGFILGFLQGLTGGAEDKGNIFNIITSIYSLACLIPGLAIEFRRLHDINKSGWNLLLALIPLVGFIIVLVYYCKESVNENNQYGETV